MKNIILLLMAGMLVSCATTQEPASTLTSQNKSPNYVVADYRNIAQEHIEDYLKLNNFGRQNIRNALKIVE